MIEESKEAPSWLLDSLGIIGYYQLSIYPTIEEQNMSPIYDSFP